MEGTTRLLSIIAVLLIVVGAVVVLTAPPVTFTSWTSAPLSSDAFERRPLPVVLGGRQLLGLAAVVAGLVAAGVVAGMRVGHRVVR